jgi:hypothetical protein
MTATADKLLKLTLGQMVLINSVVIIVFITINSFVCPDGLSGGECVKHLDNRVFLFQMIANLLFTGYYLLKIDKSKWGILTLNLFLTTIIYIAAATLHSISKAGLF